MRKIRRKWLCPQLAFSNQRLTVGLFVILIGQCMGAGATFDWTLFDNWNRRKEVRRVWKVAMFDNWNRRKEVRRVWKVAMFDSDLVWLIRPKNWSKKSRTKHYSK